MKKEMPYTVEEGNAIRDRQTILDLWERNSGEREEKRFTWMYEQNPHGVPDVWLLRDPAGNIVGAVGVGRRRFLFDGSVYEAGQPMDFFIDQRHRSLGPALHMQRTIIRDMKKKGYDLMYAFPNSKSKMVQKRAGYVQLGHFSRWSFPLRSEIIISRRFHINKLIARPAGCVLDTWLRIKNEFFGEKLPQGVACHHSADVLDVDVDGLWQSVADRSIMVGERSHDYLQWRFFQHPSIPYRIFALVQGSTLLGYMIYSLQEGLVKVADFLARDRQTLHCLFSQFIKGMRPKKAVSITLTTLGAKENLAILRTIGFIEITSIEYILISLRESLPATRLLQPERWHFTVADRDV